MKKLLFILLTLMTFAALPRRGDAAQLRHLKTHTAFADGTAYSFCEDSKGFIWTGLLGELVRYDGLRTLKFPIPGNKATSLRPNAIVGLGKDSLLLGGDFGLKVFDTKTFSFGNDISTDNNPVYAMQRIGHGKILIGCAKGLMMMSDETLSVDTITIPGSVNSLSATVYDINVAPDSTIWITTNYGIFNSRMKRGHKLPALKHIAGGPSNYFSRIAATARNIYVYAPGNGRFKRGLHVYSPKSRNWKPIELSTQLPVSALVAKDSLLFVSVDNAGISVVNTHLNKVQEVLNRTSPNSPLVSNSVYSLFIDRHGNLYAGYYQNGVQVLSPATASTFKAYSDSESFSTDGMFVRATARNYPYQITATLEKVMITDERAHTTRTIPPAAFNNCQPIDIDVAGRGFMIGVFGGGLYYLDPLTANVSHIEGSEGLRVCDIDVDSQGRVWVAATEGLYRYDGGKLDKVFNSDNSCIKSGVIRIYFDSKERGWVTTQSGMAIYDPQTDKLRNDLFPKGFIDREFVRCITEDTKGNLLFAYNRNKLFRSDSELKKFADIKHDLPIANEDINILQQLPDGSWLIGASAGLYITRDFASYRSLGHRDGIEDSHINPSHVVDNEGRIFISSAKGLLTSDLQSLMTVKERGQLRISEVRINGERMKEALPDVVDGKFKLTVPSHTGTIDIFLSDLVSTPDAADCLEYCIDSDTIWTHQSITRPISIHNTGSLNHSIKVRLSGSPETMLLIETREPRGLAILWIVLAIMAVAGVGVALFIILKRGHKAPATSEPTAAAHESEEIAAEDKKEKCTPTKYSNINIDDAELERLSKRLDLLLYDTRIYLQPDLKIGQLADKLGVSTSALSYYFSQHLATNYYRFLNSYRIKEFKEMVRHGTYRTYTLSAMAQMCGFSSRTSFFRHFKEAEGISPLDYIKRIEKGEIESSK